MKIYDLPKIIWKKKQKLVNWEVVPKRRYGKNNKVGFWGVKLAFENCKNDAVVVNPPPIWAILSLSLSKRHPQQNTALQNWALCLSLQHFCCIYQVTPFAIFFNGFLSNFFWFSFLVLDWYFWPLGICCFLFIMEEKVFFFFFGGGEGGLFYEHKIVAFEHGLFGLYVIWMEQEQSFHFDPLRPFLLYGVIFFSLNLVIWLSFLKFHEFFFFF